MRDKVFEGNRLGLLALRAEFLDFVESLVVGALGRGGVAMQFVERVAGGGEGSEDAGVGIRAGAGFGEDLFEG